MSYEMRKSFFNYFGIGGGAERHGSVKVLYFKHYLLV